MGTTTGLESLERPDNGKAILKVAEVFGQKPLKWSYVTIRPTLVCENSIQTCEPVMALDELPDHIINLIKSKFVFPAFELWT